jgi:hypothetical protein
MTEKSKKEIYKFKKFLVENHVLGTFTTNIENDENYFRKEYGFISLKDFLEKRSKEDFLSFAFDWSKTKEGHIFWQDLDTKWLRYARNN